MKFLSEQFFYLFIVIVFTPAALLSATEDAFIGNIFTVLQHFKAILKYYFKHILRYSIFEIQRLESEMNLVIPRKLIHVINYLKN